MGTVHSCSASGTYATIKATALLRPTLLFTHNLELDDLAVQLNGADFLQGGEMGEGMKGDGRAQSRDCGVAAQHASERLLHHTIRTTFSAPTSRVHLSARTHGLAQVHIIHNHTHTRSYTRMQPRTHAAFTQPLTKSTPMVLM